MKFKTVDPDGKVDIRPFNYAMSIISGKWKMQILFWLWKYPTMRYSELKRSIKGITHKVLSCQLKELEREHLVMRKEYPEVPPRVEYSLSARGMTLMPVLHEICLWGFQHYEEEETNTHL